METLQGLVEKGYARMVGVSNWKPARIREANAWAEAHGVVRLAANQPQFSLAKQQFFADPTTRGMDEETWKMHAETGMVCCCFTSQAHGYFTRLERQGESGLPENLCREFDSPENRAILDRIREVRQEKGLSVNSIALAWLISQPFPTFPLAGASRVEHVEALVDPHVQRFIERKFTHLQVCFGCTGGQHRSVYCAEHLAEHLRKHFDIRITVTHRELDIEKVV